MHVQRLQENRMFDWTRVRTKGLNIIKLKFIFDTIKLDYSFVIPFEFKEPRFHSIPYHDQIEQ